MEEESLDSLVRALEELNMKQEGILECLQKPELSLRLIAHAKATTAIRNPAGFILKRVRSDEEPPREWKQGDGPKPKLPPEVSPEGFFAISDAHMSSQAAGFFMDYDDPAVEAAHPDLWKKGGVFLKSLAAEELTHLERKYRQTFSDTDRERLMKRSEQYAKEAMQQEREQTAKGRAHERHRRLELMKEGKDPNRFWGGATEEELGIWNSRGEER
jgi:hypothetical protein